MFSIKNGKTRRIPEKFSNSFNNSSYIMLTHVFKYGMRHTCKTRHLELFCKIDAPKALVKSLRNTHEKVCFLVKL